MQTSPLIFIASLMLVTLGDGRLHSNRLSIFAFRRSKGWQFMERMNMQQGTMNMALKLKLQTKEIPASSKYTLQLVALPNAHWQKEVD